MLVLNSEQIRGMTLKQRERSAQDLLGEWTTHFQGLDVLPEPQRANPLSPELLRQLQLVGRSLLTNESGGGSDPYLMRALWMQSMIDPRRNLDAECGYPSVITLKQLRYMYDRVGVATRVVNIYPDECWAMDPVIYDGKDKYKRDSGLEETWDDLCDTQAINPLHFMHRADVLSGISRYGILLIGTDDGSDLSEPLPHIGADGRPTGKGKKLNITFLRPFDELQAYIINVELNPYSPRFCLPVYYHVIFANEHSTGIGQSAVQMTASSRIVHWSRVVHLADHMESNPVFGTPRQQPVFNPLCDVRKILGGSAEMFWKGGFPGYSFEMDPELVKAGAQVDRESMDEQIRAHFDNLQRYMTFAGFNVKSLAPQVSDPSGNLRVQMESIAISIGCPLRIFTGSEQAQLASGQDVRTWNRRLARRQNKYLSPMVVRPFIDRCIALGILEPPAEDGKRRTKERTQAYRYHVWWPDIDMPGEEERSKIADRQVTACMKYMTGEVFQLIPPLTFFTNLLGFTQDQAEQCIANLALNKLELKSPAVTQMEAAPANDAGTPPGQ